MQNAECSEQIKTVDNCFYRSECAETRSNGSEACPHEQYDYVSRVDEEAAFPVVEGAEQGEADEVSVENDL